MQRLLTVMGDHPSAWAFDHPVNAAEVTDYYDVIKQPMGEPPSPAIADTEKLILRRRSRDDVEEARSEYVQQSG